MKFQAGFCPKEARTLLSLCTSPFPPTESKKRSFYPEMLKNWETITRFASTESNMSAEIGKSPGSPYYLVFRAEEYSEKNIKEDVEINISHAKDYALDPSARVQRGFRNQFESLAPLLVKWLEILSQHGPMDLYLVGHGRGAALATLCMAWLKIQRNFSYPIGVKTYLFGAPRVGNSFFVRELHEKHEARKWCFNIRHSRDLIPFLPLGPLMNPTKARPLFCFKDVGELIFLKGELNIHGTTLTGTFSRHRVHWYAHYLKQQFKSTKDLGFLD
ncbi:MAG: hypothetical protein AAF696_34860 [Bacteroidota bacterium]